MQKKKQETPTINDPRDYVLWIRVSTKKQGMSELGLDAQIAYAKAFTKKDPVKIFKDVYSGQKLSKCKSLWEAIDYCKENGTYLLIAKTDRFRNVEEACRVLRECGEGNLKFCDLPTFNEMILKIMWSVWESQAKMGQINTRLAMGEIKKQISTEGGYMTRDGKWKTHLGREKGCDVRDNALKGGQVMYEKAQEWRATSPGYIFVSRELLKGTPRKQIIEEFNELHKDHPDLYCSPKGGPLTQSRLSLWAREILH